MNESGVAKLNLSYMDVSIQHFRRKTYQHDVATLPWCYQTHCLIIANTRGRARRAMRTFSKLSHFLAWRQFSRHYHNLTLLQEKRFPFLIGFRVGVDGQAIFVCRRVPRRVHIRSRVRVGVFCITFGGEWGGWGRSVAPRLTIVDVFVRAVTIR